MRAQSILDPPPHQKVQRKPNDLSSAEALQHISLLITEGRLPSSEGRIEGPHCPVPLATPKKTTAQEHICDLKLVQCQRASHIYRTCVRHSTASATGPSTNRTSSATGPSTNRTSSATGPSTNRTLCLAVYLVPLCCEKSAILLEKWTLQLINQHDPRTAKKIPAPMLLQAIRSHLAFSQYSAWLAQSVSLHARAVYKITSGSEQAASDAIFTGQFPQSQDIPSINNNQSIDHDFPVALLVDGAYLQVHVSSLARTVNGAPPLQYLQCSCAQQPVSKEYASPPKSDQVQDSMPAAAKTSIQQSHHPRKHRVNVNNQLTNAASIHNEPAMPPARPSDNQYFAENPLFISNTQDRFNSKPIQSPSNRNQSGMSLSINKRSPEIDIDGKHGSSHEPQSSPTKARKKQIGVNRPDTNTLLTPNYQAEHNTPRFHVGTPRSISVTDHEYTKFNCDNDDFWIDRSSNAAVARKLDLQTNSYGSSVKASTVSSVSSSYHKSHQQNEHLEQHTRLTLMNRPKRNSSQKILFSSDERSHPNQSINVSPLKFSSNSTSSQNEYFESCLTDNLAELTLSVVDRKRRLNTEVEADLGLARDQQARKLCHASKSARSSHGAGLAKFRFNSSNGSGSQHADWSHGCGALPSTSSPAPITRNKNNSFDYDATLNSVAGLKSAFYHEQSNAESGSSDSEIDSGTLCKSAPASSNLLGNFEESALKGRIKPFGQLEGFILELAASGAFCPAHVRLPLTTFFFNFNDAPSPFLGHCELDSLGKRGYHVPRKGTVQATLFNPNDTVVKMFVVRYDLSDMPPYAQTFVRQRTFMMPRNGTLADARAHRSWLRYLIHLRFATTRSGRLYIHTDIRMLFSRKSELDVYNLELDSKQTAPQANSAASRMRAATTTCADKSGRLTYEAPPQCFELKSFTEMPRNPKYSPRKSAMIDFDADNLKFEMQDAKNRRKASNNSESGGS